MIIFRNNDTFHKHRCALNQTKHAQAMTIPYCDELPIPDGFTLMSVLLYSGKEEGQKNNT